MQEPAGSPDGRRAGGGEPGASRRRSERRGATAPFALLRRAGGKPAGQTRDSTEKARRRPEGLGLLGADELGWNFRVLSSDRCLSLQPPDGACAVRPQPWLQEGALSGVGRGWAGLGSARPGRATPRSRGVGAGAAAKRAASGGRAPRASSSLSRRDPGLPATLGRGAAQLAGEAHRRPLGPRHPRRRAGKPFSLQMKASDRRPRPSLGNATRGTWYRIYPHSFLP